MAESPLRVAHCIHGLGLGGAQKVIASIIRHRDAEAFRHFVFSCHGGVLREELEAAGGVVRIVERRVPKLDVSWVGALAEIMEREQVDVVHTHLFGDSLHGYLAARRAGKLPVVMTLHNVYPSFNVLQRLGYRWLLRRRVRPVACSQAVAGSFAGAGVRTTSTLMTIVNGVDTPALTEPDVQNRQTIRARFGAGPGTILLAAVGRLVEQKGHAYLLRALARAVRTSGVDLRLVLLGEGPLGGALAELARAEGVAERTCFAGFVPDVAGLLPAIDVVVFSSLHEGLPIALLEAMAAARPIVATELPSFSEALRNGEDGLLVPACEVEPLAEALARVSLDDGLRARLGAAAHHRFCDHFSAERMVCRYEALYREICAPSLRRSERLAGA